MQRLYHINKALDVQKEPKSEIERQSESKTAVFKQGKSSTELEMRWSWKLQYSSHKHQHKATEARSAATPHQPHKCLTFPGGRSAEPMTCNLSKISRFLQQRSHIALNSTTNWLPRERRATEAARDGGQRCSAISTLLLSLFTLSRPLSPSPLSLVSESLRLGAGMRVLLIRLCASCLILRKASHLHKRSNPPLTNTGSAHLSHLCQRAPPLRATSPTYSCRAKSRTCSWQTKLTER